MTKRTDIHRPSAIDPTEYCFIAFNCLRIDDLGSALFLQAERKRLDDHRQRTGGRFASHQHGGNCQCCGSVNCIYTAAFYHQKTNEYLLVGLTCAEKLEMSYSATDANLFLKRCRQELKIAKGKQAAKRDLNDLGLQAAWDIYEARPRLGYVERQEQIISEMVSSLVRYGRISDKQVIFAKSLLNQIQNRAKYLADREAKHQAAAECPEGKFTFVGKILSSKVQDVYANHCSFLQIKILVEHESGYKAWGTAPASITNGYDGSKQFFRGKTVSFSATFTRSKDDPKFGFFSRPTKGKLLNDATPAAAEAQPEPSLDDILDRLS